MKKSILTPIFIFACALLQSCGSKKNIVEIQIDGKICNVSDKSGSRTQNPNTLASQISSTNTPNRFLVIVKNEEPFENLHAVIQSISGIGNVSSLTVSTLENRSEFTEFEFPLSDNYKYHWQFIEPPEYQESDIQIYNMDKKIGWTIVECKNGNYIQNKSSVDLKNITEMLENMKKIVSKVVLLVKVTDKRQASGTVIRLMHAADLLDCKSCVILK